MVKKVTAPKTYDPGRGRPKEHLAYLNDREMAYLRSINGNNMERGPRGLPSFPPDDSLGSNSGNSRPTGGGSKGPGGPSGPNSGPSGGLGGGGKGAGSSGTQSRGPGGPSGPNSGPSQSAGSKAAPSAPSRTPSSPMGGQGPSFSSTKAASSYNKDRTVQQKVQINDARNAVKNTPAARNDLALGGIRTLNVGPVGTPVNVGRSIAGGMSFIGPQVSTSRPKTLSAADVYRPSAISPGGLATPGSIPISRAMNFADTLPGRRDPQMAEALKSSALSGQGLFSVKGATPEQQALVDRIGPTVLSVSMETGLDPRTILGQALTESTTSRHSSKVSKLARDANNLFGVKATGATNQFWKGDVATMPTKEVIAGKTVTVNEPFRKYESPEQALMDYGRMMQSGRYKNAAEFPTPEEQLRSIRGSGYATHPAKSYVDMGVKNASRISFGGGAPSLQSVQPTGSVVKSVAQAETPTGTVGSIYKTARDYYNSMPSIKDISEGYSELQKNLDAYRQAKTGPLSAVTGPIADARLKEAVTGYASQGIQALKDFISPSSAMAATPSGPIMSGEKAAAKTIAQAEGEKILDVENVPESDDVYGPKNVSPEVQELMADIDRKNKYGVRGIKSLPGVGDVVQVGDAFRKVFTGKNTTEADADLKRAYMQGNATQRAELERGYPNLTKFAQQAGLEPQLPMSNYENWRQRSFGTGGGGTSTTVAGAGGTPDIGSGGKAEYRPIPRQVADAGQADAAEKKESGRPQAYYNWDAGVGIPSPGDPDYTLYLKYLEEKAAARAAVS